MTIKQYVPLCDISTRVRFLHLFFCFAVCTPIGFIKLFSVVGQVLVKPNLLRDINEEFHAFNMEEASVMRKIAGTKRMAQFPSGTYFKTFSYIAPLIKCPVL